MWGRWLICYRINAYNPLGEQGLDGQKGEDAVEVELSLFLETVLPDGTLIIRAEGDANVKYVI